MTKPQKILNDLLTHSGGSLNEVQKRTISSLTNTEAASIFVFSAFLVSSFKFLAEEGWLRKHNTPLQNTSYEIFVTEIFNTELLPINFLLPAFLNSSVEKNLGLAETSADIESVVINTILSRSSEDQQVFAAKALRLMTELFKFENELELKKKKSGLHLGLTLYRAFDALDRVLKINYLYESGMKTDMKNSERLYEGAGAGVQSGYSTILLTLDYLTPVHGSRFVDLGSGYGKVGFIVGLVRPDIIFQGYEYVQHRVENATHSAIALGIQDHVQFYKQDLSSQEFKIPEAEIYYLFDPFSEETYLHVLDQLVHYSRNRKITVVTKGNARSWLMEIANKEGWAAPVDFDNTNLSLFKN